MNHLITILTSEPCRTVIGNICLIVLLVNLLILIDCLIEIKRKK